MHKKRGSLKHAIKKKGDKLLNKLKDSKWDNLPDEEKNLKFYSMVIDLVEQYNENKITVTPAAGDTGGHPHQPTDGGDKGSNTGSKQKTPKEDVSDDHTADANLDSHQDETTRLVEITKL